jgi:hypothetical protein
MAFHTALLCMLFGASTAACAFSLTLAWDRNPEPDILAYHLYYGPSSCKGIPDCTYPSQVRVPPNASCSEPNAVCHTFQEGTLQDGVRYFFAVTATNIYGESGFSNELEVSPRASGDLLARDIIVDNGDPGTSSTGMWSASGGAAPYDGDSLWARDGATYRWQFTGEAPGTYEVLMWWSGYDSRASNVPIVINHASGTARITIDQARGAGRWNSLGTYAFGSSGSVGITAAYGDSVSTCADAVWFSPVSNALPPVAVIDAIAPNPSVTGEAVTFRGHGSDPDGTVIGCSWESSLDGLLSHSTTFTANWLSHGTHTIRFRATDDDGLESAPAERILTILPTVAETVIDNGGPGTSSTGSWEVSGAAGFYGASSLYSRDGERYTWTFTPAVSGSYRVSMWWTVWPSRSAGVPVDVRHAGGTTRIQVNQQQSGSRWNQLGQYRFESGKSYTVSVTAQPGPSSTCADAVRFEYLGS